MSTTATPSTNAPPILARGAQPDRPLRLPELRDAVREAIDQAAGAALALEELQEALAAVDEPLAQRIKRNRERSRRQERHRRRNGRHPVDRVVVTSSGLAVTCARCDRVLAIAAAPGRPPAPGGNGNGKPQH